MNDFGIGRMVLDRETFSQLLFIRFWCRLIAANRYWRHGASP